MKKIIKEREFVAVYSYSKKYGLLTERTYYRDNPFVVLVRTVFVRPAEVDHAFFIENETDCIHDLYSWFKDYRYERRPLKINPYFTKSGNLKMKWYDI